ncbi:MAG: cupin domain-containing protein [Ruminococcus sp.]|nr:cupin domain-containing protein [Ruminococcus sp.]
MEIIRKCALDYALEQEYRQYLTGHLSRPQPFLQHVEDDIEIGISHYREFTADTPHMHPAATEHAYILQGSVKVKLLDGSAAEYEFHEGDFFVLQPGIACAAKNKADTKVLFIKSPGVNDKTVVEVDEETEKWLRTWE